jgi:hypothetical protein
VERWVGTEFTQSVTEYWKTDDLAFIVNPLAYRDKVTCQFRITTSQSQEIVTYLEYVRKGSKRLNVPPPLFAFLRQSAQLVE